MAILYAAKGGSSASDLYTIDSSTGVATSVGAIGFAITGLAFDPTTGILYGSTSSKSPILNDALITIDTSTGEGTLIAGFSGDDFGAVADICFDSDGQLYGWSEYNDEFVIIDKDTAITAAPHANELNTFGDACDVNPLDGELYVFPKGGPWSSGTNTFDGWTTYYTVDKTTGAATLAGQLTGGPDNNNDSVSAGSFDTSGVFWAFINPFGSGTNSFLVNIDVDTGVVSAVATMVGRQWDGLAWTPGPATLHANFSGTPLSGRAPLTVNFTDASVAGAGGAITSRSWNFGDSGTSTATNPSHVYTSSGTYTVSLTVTSPDGTDTKTRTNYVHVTAPQTLYAVTARSDVNASLYTVNPSTGAMNFIGDTGYKWFNDIAFDPTDGILYGIVDDAGGSYTKLVTLDISTGAATEIGITQISGTDAYLEEIAIDSSGNMYGWELEYPYGRMVTVDKATAAIIAPGSLTNEESGALSFDNEDNLWIASGSFGSTIFTVNTSTGGMTTRGNLGFFYNLHSGTFDNLDTLYAGDGSDLYIVAPTNPTQTGGTSVTVTHLSTFSEYSNSPYVEIRGIAWQPALTTVDFLLSVSPDPVTVAPGASGSATLTSTSFNSDTESITLSSSGEPSGMTIGFDDNPINAGDSTNINISVGGGVANGAYSITITGTGTLNTHTVTFQVFVTTGLSITLNPNRGNCNTTISVSGSGFAANSALTFFWDNVNVTAYITGTTTTDSSGNFSGLLYNIGTDTAGAHTVKIQDASGLNETRTFTVVIPTFTMSPTSANNSRAINLTFTGTGYTSSILLKVMIDIKSGRDYGTGYGSGGYALVDLFSFASESAGSLFDPPIITNGSLTTDSSGNFSVTIQIPKRMFPSGNWEIYIGAASAYTAWNVGPPACASDHHTLQICSSGTSFDDTDLIRDPVILGHSTQDWPATVIPGPSSQIAVTTGGHTYIIQEGYGTVKCGDSFYSLHRVTPDSTSHSSWPIPSWYHVAMVYRVAADGSSSSYHFIDPLPYYSFNLSNTDFFFNNNWGGTLDFVWQLQFFHAQIVSDGTNIWVGLMEAASKDYPYISDNDVHAGQDSQATQVAARGNMASLVAQKIANSSTTWPVRYHDQTGTLDFHNPNPPDSDSGDKYSGVYAQGQLAVYHFNGSSFDRLGAIEAKYNRINGIGDNPLYYNNTYLSGVSASASEAEPGVVHFIWSEGGAWGRRFDGTLGGTTYFVWDSDDPNQGGLFNHYGVGAPNLDYRMNYSRWDASGKTLDNDILHTHVDRTNYYNLSGGSKIDPIYVSKDDFACSGLVQLKNEHGSPIAIVSRAEMNFNGFSYSPAYYDANIKFWDLSSGSINELQTLSDSVLPQPEEVQARLDNIPSTGINRIYHFFDSQRPDLIQGVDGLGPHGLYSSLIYEDPLLGGAPIYLVSAAFINYPIISMEDTLTEGFFRIPVDGSAPFDVMDGRRDISILPNKSVGGYGFIAMPLDNFFSEPRNVWVPTTGTGLGPYYGYGSGLWQLDRMCNRGWVNRAYGAGTHGYFYGGGTMTGGSGNVPVWSDYDRTHFWWDGNNTIYLPGIWETDKTFTGTTSYYGGMGICIIRRGVDACCTVLIGGQLVRIYPNGDVKLVDGDFKMIKINTDGSISSVNATDFAQIQIHPDGTVKRSG